MKRYTFTLSVAYGLLTTVSLWALACDTNSRREIALADACQRRAAAARADDPSPMTRLADSPFLKKRSPASSRSVAASNSISQMQVAMKPRIMPAGVFFLKVPVQTETADGPKDFAPGTQVRVLRHQGGKVRVTLDGTDFLIEEWQLTRDADSVAALARSTS